LTKKKGYLTKTLNPANLNHLLRNPSLRRLLHKPRHLELAHILLQSLESAKFSIHIASETLRPLRVNTTTTLGSKWFTIPRNQEILYLSLDQATSKLKPLTINSKSHSPFFYSCRGFPFYLSLGFFNYYFSLASLFLFSFLSLSIIRFLLSIIPVSLLMPLLDSILFLQVHW